MKHLALLDSRIPIAIALCFVAAGASAQDGLGQHDADTATTAISLGELTLASDISAPKVTRPIQADFYRAADVEDWYWITLRDSAFHPACVAYNLKFQAQLSGFNSATGDPNPSLTVYLNANLQLPTNAVTNPYLAIVPGKGTSCGATVTYLINVRRPPTQSATPAPYVLTLGLEREFYGVGISAISPTSGPVGTPVTITGQQLLPQVAFQGVAAPLNTFSPTSITTTVPPGATTGPITVYTSASQQVFTVTSSRPAANTSTTPNNPRVETPRGPGSASLPQTTRPDAPGIAPCCATVPNPALVGRLGRLVVAFPADAVPTGTRVVVRKDGKDVQAGYGNQTWDLLPGNYDVSVGGKVVSNVSVQSRSDTNVRVGVLRVSAGDQTKADVVDGSAVISSGYGSHLVGLPVGSYGLRISGATESFTIQDGQVTDF